MGALAFFNRRTTHTSYAAVRGPRVEPAPTVRIALREDLPLRGLMTRFDGIRRCVYVSCVVELLVPLEAMSSFAFFPYVCIGAVWLIGAQVVFHVPDVRSRGLGL